MAFFATTVNAQSPCNCAYGADLITNGNFSAGNTGFSTDFSWGVSYNPGSYMVTNNTINKVPFTGGDYGHTFDHTVGNSSGSMLVVQGSSSSSTDTVWAQNITVSPNTSYCFSFWGFRIKDNGGPPLNVVIKNGSGTVVATIMNSGDIDFEDHSWEQSIVSWNSGGLSGTYTIEIIQTAFSGSSKYFAIDDIKMVKQELPIEFTTVPATSSYSVIYCDNDPAYNPFCITVNSTGAPFPSGTTFVWGKVGGSILFPYAWNSPTICIPPNTVNSGTYYVTVTTPDGCTKTLYYKVGIKAATLANISGNINLCVGECVELANSTSSSYVSPLPNGSGGTGVIKVNGVQIFPNGSGEYNWCPTSAGSHTITYTYTNTYGCVDTASMVVNVSGSLWSKTSANTTSIDDGRAVAVDEAGNVYATGTYNSATSFDGVPVIGINGKTGMFLAKYDDCGKIQWVSFTKSVVDETGVDVKVDKNTGKIYVVGKSTKELVTFVDAQTTSGNLGTSVQQFNHGYFIARYKPNGTLDAVYSHYDEKLEPTGMALNRSTSGTYSGRVYVSGRNPDLNNGQAALMRHTTTASSINFLHKMKSNAYQGNEATDIDVDNYNRIYLVGNYKKLQFPSSMTAIGVTDPSNTDAFVAKFSETLGATNPPLNWLKGAGILGTYKRATANTVAVNDWDQLYVGGYFYGNLGNPFNVGLGYSSSFSGNGYVTRLNIWNGNASWFTRIEGTSSYAIVRGLTSEDHKYVYAVGHYRGSKLKVFSSSLGQYGFGTNSSHNSFVMRIKSTDGKEVWANYTANVSSGYHEAKNVAIDGLDNVYSVGRYNGQMLYGLSLASAITLNSAAGTNDMFVTRNKISGGAYYREGAAKEEEMLTRKDDDAYTLYPNPNNGSFQLELKDGFTTAGIEVKDLYGKIVFKKQIMATDNAINMQNVASGMYIVTVTIDGDNHIEKVVVK